MYLKLFLILAGSGLALLMVVGAAVLAGSTEADHGQGIEECGR